MKINISKTSIKGPFLSEEYITKVLMNYAKESGYPKSLIMDKNKTVLDQLDKEIKKIDRDTNVVLKETKEFMDKTLDLRKRNNEKLKVIKTFLSE